MARTAARPKARKGGKGKPADKDNPQGLERVYTRLKPADKKRLDEAAAEDERSTMKYLERLVLNHLAALDKKRK